MKLLFSHSRSSLFFSLKLISLKKNEIILIPDYNCSSFMTPIRKLSINYKTYSVNSKLIINIKELKKKISKNVRAIVIVNYFGVPSQISKISKLCKKKKIILINDNAHGASGIYNKKKLINYGDIGFESYHKIFNKIQNLSILSINNKSLQERIKSLKINQTFKTNYSSRLLFLAKIKIKNILFKKIRINKTNKKNKNDNLFYNIPVSNFDINLYNKINFQNEKKARHKNINSIMKIADRFNVTPLYKNLNQSLMLWYFPIIKLNYKFLNYLKIKKIPYVNWPSFPKELNSKKNNIIKKKIVCLPLDYNYYE